MKRAFVLCALLAIGVYAPTIHAAGLYDSSVAAKDIVFDPDVLLLGVSSQVYITLRNNGERDIEGSVIFSIDGTRVITKPFSIRSNGRPEDVWMSWKPTSLGTHTVRVDVVNDSSTPDVNLDDNSVSETVEVDLDTDKDGVPNRLDKDQDNDGLLNDRELANHTDPLRWDTDGDGVSDKADFYPLDPAHSVYVPPAPAPKPVVVPVREKPAPEKTKNPVLPTADQKPVLPIIVPEPEFAVPPVTTTESVILAPTTTAVIIDTSSTELSIVKDEVSPSIPHSPYRFLWAVAGATAGAGIAFAAIDWWKGRRSEEE